MDSFHRCFTEHFKKNTLYMYSLFSFKGHSAGIGEARNESCREEERLGQSGEWNHCIGTRTGSNSRNVSEVPHGKAAVG